MVAAHDITSWPGCEGGRGQRRDWGSRAHLQYADDLLKFPPLPSSFIGANTWAF
jgi:hypothetical protein